MDMRIIAHRGASGYAPENTLEAFALAAELGAFAVELDVYLTADNRLAVHHDGNVSRMTNGECGEFIEKMTMSELKSYRFCGNYADRYPDARLCELWEVYELMKASGMVVNTELQSVPRDDERRRLYIDLLHETAAKYGMGDSVIYSAFNADNLIALKSADQGCSTALLYTQSEAMGWTHGMTPWEFAKQLGCSAIHPHYKRVIDRGYCDVCHEFGLKVHPWTVNTAAEINELLDRGCDAVITNYPDILTK